MVPPLQIITMVFRFKILFSIEFIGVLGLLCFTLCLWVYLRVSVEYYSFSPLSDILNPFKFPSYHHFSILPI